MKCRLFFCSILMCLSLFSCQRKFTGVDLSSAPELEINTQWAVITDPYVIFRTQPDLASDATAVHGRRGEIHEIVGKRIIIKDKMQTLVYQFKEGWLPDTSVTVYSNKLKAENAGKSMGL